MHLIFIKKKNPTLTAIEVTLFHYLTLRTNFPQQNKQRKSIANSTKPFVQKCQAASSLGGTKMAAFFRLSLDAANRHFHPSFLRSRHPCTQVYTVPNTLSLSPSSLLHLLPVVRRRLGGKREGKKTRMKRGGRGGGWLKSTTRKPTKTGKEAKKRGETEGADGRRTR